MTEPFNDPHRELIEQAFAKGRQALCDRQFEEFAHIATAISAVPELTSRLRTFFNDELTVINPMQYSGFAKHRYGAAISEMDTFTGLAEFVHDNPQLQGMFFSAVRNYLNELAKDPDSGVFYRLFSEANPKTRTGQNVAYLSGFITPEIITTYFDKPNVMFESEIVASIVLQRPDLLEGLPYNTFFLLGQNFAKRIDYDNIEKLAKALKAGTASHPQYGLANDYIDFREGIIAGMEESSDYCRRELRAKFARYTNLWGAFRGKPGTANEPSKPQGILGGLASRVLRVVR